MLGTIIAERKKINITIALFLPKNLLKASPETKSLLNLADLVYGQIIVLFSRGQSGSCSTLLLLLLLLLEMEKLEWKQSEEEGKEEGRTHLYQARLRKKRGNGRVSPFLLLRTLEATHFSHTARDRIRPPTPFFSGERPEVTI